MKGNGTTGGMIMIRMVGVLYCAVMLCVATSPGSAATYSPRILLELSIEPNDVGELRNVLQTFALAEGLILEDVGSRMPPLHGKHLLFFTLKRDESLEVIVQESVSDGGVGVAFYDLSSDPQFEGMASRLETTLSRRWQLATVPMTPADPSKKGGADPDVILEFDVAEKEVDDLRSLIEEFARSEGFTFEDVGSQMPTSGGSKSIVALNLTRGNGIEVFVGDLQGIGRFHVAFYHLQSDREFDEVVSRLKGMLQQKWPTTDMKILPE